MEQRPFVCIVFAERRTPVFIRPFTATTEAAAIHRALGMTLSMENARGYELWSNARKVSAYYCRGAGPVDGQELARQAPAIKAE
jgi:hypothetical protein